MIAVRPISLLGLSIALTFGASLSEAQEQPPPGYANRSGTVYRVGGDVSAPQLIHRVEPTYSDEALKAKLEGTVELYVEVEPGGSAGNLKVRQGVGMGLDEKAIEAVQKWRFSPAIKDGKPVTVAALITVHFRLQKDSPVGPRVVTWNANMDHVYVDGVLWFRAGSPGRAAIVATVIDTGQYMMAQMAITNRSNQKFDVVPDHLTLTLLGPKSKPLQYISPERVIGKINSSIAWSRVFAGLAASGATRQETTVSNTSGNVDLYGADIGYVTGTYGGTSTSTRTVPDEQRQQQIWEQQHDKEHRAYDSVQSVATNAMRASTLEPGQEIRGSTYFKRDRSCASRKGCDVRLVVTVGDTTFQFPISFKQL